MLRVGSTRFIHHLLSRVIFPEADLAGLDKQEIKKIDWGQRALYVAAGFTLLLFGTLWANGFSANHLRLEQLRSLLQGQQRQESVAQDNAKRVLPSLDSSYSATRVFPEPDDVSLLQRAGLYQYDAVQPVVYQAYRERLESLLLPRVSRQIEAQIRANLSNRERLLDNLRAYLMLNLVERRDPAYLRDWLATDWSRLYPGDSRTQQGLNDHFERLLAAPFGALPLNEPLVAQARDVLRGEALANVLYRALRERARELPSYRLGQKLGPQGDQIEGSDYDIPGLYTQQGYQRYFLTQGADLARQLLQDNWVLGKSGTLSPADFNRLLVDVEQLYFRDYSDHWASAIGRLSLEKLGTTRQGARQISALTAASSPLLKLLAEIRENTRFDGIASASDEPDATDQDTADKPAPAARLASAAAGMAKSVLTNSLPDSARKSLVRRFEPLHQLLDKDGAPVDRLVSTLQALDELQQQLAGLDNASAPEQAAFELAKTRMTGRRDAINQVRSAAVQLPQPIGRWLGQLAEDSWMLVLADAQRYINQRYQSDLHGTYRASLQKRYPFNAHSESEVAIADFREFFKAQGSAERFFDTYLKPFVSGGPGQHQVRLVDGRGLQLSRQFLHQMDLAHRIQRSFFGENVNEPQIAFKLEPYSLDPNLGRADFRFGDSQLEYRHGPIVQAPFSWPAQANDGRTSLVVEEIDGRRLGIEKNTGPWSLFRLLDLMQLEYHSGRDVLMVKANLGGRRVNYLLYSQRAPSPFDIAMLREFKLPASL
ncbi:hypothetical protein D3C85_639560 [compost metagenome]